jgi:hypothetical protein
MGKFGWYSRKGLQVCNLMHCVTVYGEVIWSTEDT